MKRIVNSKYSVSITARMPLVEKLLLELRPRVGFEFAIIQAELP